MDVLREEVDGHREVLQRQLSANVVHEIGQRAVRERPETAKLESYLCGLLSLVHKIGQRAV